MASDPAFLFYPGDYLRDTQCLSEPVQVAYDRIMCEHMRNICISKERLNFFTKRLNVEQKKELASVMTETKDGWHIAWVAESIEKRRKYSDSRRKNRSGNKKDMSHISKTYVSHMENEDVNENEIEKVNKKESPPDFTKPDIPGDTVVMPFETEPMRKLWASWKAARWATHGVRYPMNGEQADLRRMQGMTFQQVEETIQQAMAAGWKNLYPEKNGTTKSTSKKQQRQQGIAESIAKRYGADSPVWKNE